MGPNGLFAYAICTAHVRLKNELLNVCIEHIRLANYVLHK